MKQLHDLQDEALALLFGVGTVLGPAMAERLGEEGLTTARAEVIWRLHHRGPMTQRQLSEALQCTPRNVTGLVDALEGADFVQRQPHPTDRRAIHVTLTPRGEHAARGWATRSRQLARDVFAGFSADQLTGLIEALDLVLMRFGTRVDSGVHGG